MVGARHIPRWSIRTKTLVLVAAYVVALCAVYGAFTVSLVRREVARTQDRLQQTADLVAAELNAYVESGRQRLRTVSRLPGMTYGLRTILEASDAGRIPPWTTLHYLFFKSPVFTGGAFLLDDTGKVLWTEPPGRPWLGATLAANPTVAEVYALRREAVSGGLPADALLDRRHAIIAVPVNSPTGTVEGALGGIIDLTAPELVAILSAVSTSEGRFIEVLDQHGAVIVGSPRATRGAADSNEWMLATAPLSEAPWRAVAGQPSSIALAEVWQSQRLLLGLGAAVLAIAMAIGAPIVNGFVHAIRRLTDAAEIMSGGDLSQPVDVGTRGDELATLGRTFEQMRVELDRSRAALVQRLEEREELIRLKEVFLAGISHELRTPLNAIIGYTDMLSDEVIGTDARDYLVTVRAQSEHLLRLLSDLLTLSGLNTGTLAVEVCPVRIPAILARLRPLADELRAGKDVAVHWDCPDGLPTIETDPLRLEQILANLLTNALKFTASGRVVIHVFDRRAQGCIAFEVHDTGIGIASHELPHIFDEFRQVDRSLTRAYGGVGLGLSLVQKLVALLHGTITVESELGVGSTFRIELPVRFADRDAASAAA